jgi:hypothetical protein
MYNVVVMTSNELREDLRGWWRILETSQWANKSLDTLGPALISITGHGAASECAA